MKRIILLLVFLIFLSGCSYSNCGYDLNCFEEYAKDCSKSKVNIIQDSNDVRITLRGVSKEGCKVSFKIEEISREYKNKYPNEALILEGKSLTCNIPIKEDYSEEIMNIGDNVDNYCSGPIKDFVKTGTI